MAHSFLQRLRAWYHWHPERWRLERRLKPDVAWPVVEVGGFLVPLGVLDERSVCYCAGAGEKIGLEMGLSQRFGSRVVALDPTPRAIAFVQTQPTDPQRFCFVPVGLWSRDETLRFYAPADDRFVSHSIVDAEAGRSYFEAPCKRLSTLMAERGDREIDLLKMNIEGAEYEVLSDMVATGVKPRSLVIAFEGSTPLANAILWTDKLRQYGYRLVAIHTWCGTFVRSDVPPPRP